MWDRDREGIHASEGYDCVMRVNDHIKGVKCRKKKSIRGHP
jgi:hypothetical protein